MRSLSQALGRQAAGKPTFAGVPAAAAPATVLLRGERSTRGALRLRMPLDRPPPLGLEIALTLAVLLGAAGLGAVRGGQLDAFVATQGSLSDVAARTLGFGVDVVTVSGATHMSESRILSIAGISSKNSLPFFDVAAARARLEADPLVKQASVRKLYPDQIVVEIVERTPYGVWQKDGQVHAIAADGAPIDEVRDGRYVDLPFVVGEGANSRVREFTALLDAMDELKPRVEAGVLVGQRSWNLKLKSGIEVKLPEVDPQAAIATLLRLHRQSRILDRDVLALDLRTPGRVFARLSQEAAAEWADAHAPKKGPQP
ncbi:MAG TPA: FtsQ-type POTRA domain-containing protein [Roseiarcus sp.]|nr:FtsQ-type POTRA domain-containing protein [Roseiarcus sp.]